MGEDLRKVSDGVKKVPYDFGRCQMYTGSCQMVSGRCQVVSGRCRGFAGKDNQLRELLIKTGMAVGGDNQISVEISPCSIEITYYYPTACSS